MTASTTGPLAPVRWPLYIRAAVLAAVTGVTGFLTYRAGPSLLDSETNPELHDTIPAVGRAMMSACSLLFIAAFVFAIANAARIGVFTWKHGVVLGLAMLVTLVDAVVNAHPW